MTVTVTSFTLTKRWFSKCLLILTLFLISGTAETEAQVLQTGRFEYPLAGHEEDFTIIPAGASGLFLHRVLFGSKGDQIQVVKLDTSFRETWAGYIPVEKNYLIMGKKAYGGKLYLLLRYRDYTRNDLLLYAINDADETYTLYTIRGFIPISPSEFQISDKSVLVGGYYNRVPVVLHFSFSTQKSKVLPGLFNESGELTQIQVYKDGTFDVLISSLNFKRQRTLWMKSYDPEGNLLSNGALDPEENKHLIFGRSVKTGNNMQIVAGVYGNRSSEYSRGMFIASIDPSGMQQLRYYNFADLKNFFKYMRAPREQRIKNRIERKKIKGKKIRFNYRFLVHELIPYKDQYILLGEAFYPKYISADRGYSGFFYPGAYSRSVVQNGRIFDGYYYTHAVVMGFDSHGNLLWDNSFEITDVKTFTLEQFVKLEVHADKIALLYLYENQIRTKIIQGDQVIEGKASDPIKTLNPYDVVKNTYDDKLEYWYKDNLYAYGIQEIVNHDVKKYGRRKVFYINKVTLGK
jgi:hypothetical protein